MPLNEDQMSRLLGLRERRVECDLDDKELLELYSLEKGLSSNGYGQVVAVLASFPPYLNARPHLIPTFVDALYEAAHAAYRGVQTRAELMDFLASKSYVDNDLGLALANHRAEFERAIQSVAQ